MCNNNINVFQYMGSMNHLSMFLNVVNENEIKKIVNNFKSKTSTGYKVKLQQDMIILIYVL